MLETTDRRREFPETFFVQKIEQGIGPHLTDRERDMLLTPVAELAGAFNPEEGVLLQVKCFKALSNAYRTDAGNTPLSPASAAERRSNAEKWREANVLLYQSSNRVISGVVQNWYLSEGRKLEAQTRLRPLIAAAVVVGLLLLAVVVILLARPWGAAFFQSVSDGVPAERSWRAERDEVFSQVVKTIARTAIPGRNTSWTKGLPHEPSSRKRCGGSITPL